MATLTNIISLKQKTSLVEVFLFHELIMISKYNKKIYKNMFIKKNEKSGPKAFSNDEFDEKIKDSDYIRIGSYINAETPIELECKLCGKRSLKKPKIYNRTLCECKKETNNSFSLLGRKITNEEFDLRIKDLGFKRIDNYVNTNTHINFECKSCKEVVNKTPKQITKYICECKIVKPSLSKNQLNMLISLINY